MIGANMNGARYHHPAEGKHLLGAALICLLLLAVIAWASVGCGSTTTTTKAAGPSTSVGETTVTSGATTSSAAGSTTSVAAGAQVVLEKIAINPTSITIKVGDTVTWTNKDGFAHRLVGDKSEFDSGDMAGGATYSFTPKSAGTIAYHCSIHPSMKGTIVVQ
jgi:plastocyanin